MMIHRRRIAKAIAALGLVSSLALTGCATMSAPSTVVDAAVSKPELSTLAKLIQDAGLTETLRGAGPFTVFAPTDEAFKAVPAATMAQLASNRDLLRSVLTYHVVPGKVTAAEVKTGPAKTVQGADIPLSRAGTFVTVDEAMVTQADVSTGNGVVHVIDRVLMPPAPRR
jgi:uncharacterized surface protein with fasciclin (FAS1) repeats